MKIQILIGCVLVLMLQECASVNGIEDSNNFGKCVDVIDSIWEFLIRNTLKYMYFIFSRKDYFYINYFILMFSFINLSVQINRDEKFIITRIFA